MQETAEEHPNRSPEPSAVSGNLSLLVCGPEGLRSFPLRPECELVLGRHESCQIALPNPALSRYHARFVRRGANVTVEDLGSRHGTWLSGQRLEREAELELGMAVRLADIVVTLTTLSEAGWGTTKQGALQSVALYLGERSHELRERLRRAAASELPVLLCGEIGTGKNLAALEIHGASQRRGPLRVLDCAAIGHACTEAARSERTEDALPELAQTQLGHVEEARFGTLFLDEVGELPPAAQAALFLVLETLAADFRLVAATRRDLRAMVERGEFSEELSRKLNGITIELPSLRARRDEIAALARHFLAQADGAREIDPVALSQLEAYDWPGNIRELRNVLARASSLALGPCIGERDLPDDIRAASKPTAVDTKAAGTASLRAHLKAVERAELLRALERTQGNQRKAALLLGIPLRTFERHLRALREHQKGR